ncbi:uncharacterized protein J8A68_005666 [[Candida] subhashii]|uniref:Rho-GAP domain-containing protein n=1 Tax=[Candida] subhashii TaxID=561895 RepID=A0A8J5QEU2_9ASCO|nr:uncharacterized protein J8A68_005666 [[Candida] subhashii]KAG7660849.1 hypothetical protein J8A68_005666 [[Candida] subhashii]
MTDNNNNSYWSCDYKSGINSLKQQSFKSLQQLHETRKLVYNYMNYYHSNSQYLNKYSIDMFPIESIFFPYTTTTTTTTNNRPRIPSGSFRNYQQVTHTAAKDTAPAADAATKDTTDTPVVTLETGYTKYIDQMAWESRLLLQLASTIDKDVLEDLKLYLKHHEPKIHQEFNRLEEIYDDYIECHNKLQKIKLKYEEQVRLQEFNNSNIAIKIDNQDDDNDVLSSADTSYVEEEPIPEPKEPSPESVFNFPLPIGPIKINNNEELKQFISQLINQTPTIKRKIPLPGYRNETFSSDSLCKVLSKLRISGFTPSRANLERFGQALLDLKFLVSTSFLNKKFKSEGVWFEWSDLAFFVSEFNNDNSEALEVITSRGSGTPSMETTTKFINEVAETTKRFEGMFTSMKSTILKSNHAEQMIDLEEKYKFEYLELQELKYLLENGISSIIQYLERFEKVKIELIYRSLSRLSEILDRYMKQQSKRITDLSTDFLTRINHSKNYKYDFDCQVDNFATGIYFPSIASPESIKKGGGDVNSSFQNLKYKFNLYKDFPLQLQLNSSTTTEEHPDLLSTSSIPYFLFEIIKIIEGKQPDLESLQSHWTSPLNYQTSWKIKQDITLLLADTPIPSDVEISESGIHQELLLRVLDYLQGLEIADLIQFFRDWILEISDSMISFIIYDSIIQIYEKQEGFDGVMKHLSSIPRSNLSSLIYLLEHIAKVFQIDQIPNYSVSDEFGTDIQAGDDDEKIGEVVKKLNSMDMLNAIPFVHLIMRPSTAKHSEGFKPPLDIYDRLLVDLLKVENRIRLCQVLVGLEQKCRLRKQNEKRDGAIAVRKLSNSRVDAIDSLTTPEKQRSGSTSNGGNGNNLSVRPTSEEFTLRPFRTKATPQPSPHGSPRTPAAAVIGGSSGLERCPSPLKLSSSTSTSTSTNNFVAPMIDIEFEKEK